MQLDLSENSSMKLKTVFISDTHLGGVFSQTKDLLDFLSSIKDERPESIYLVGDFIDGWKLQRYWTWNNDCSLVLRKILSLVKHGTIVYYTPGNHDEFIRDYIHDAIEINLGNIHVCNEFIHKTADGRNLLVVHGDLFDLAIKMKFGRLLAKIGDIGYDLLIRLNGIVNFFRKKFNLNYWSLSKAIKSKVKQATAYIGDFEELLADYALERGCSGVVCGHIHTADIKKIKNVDYYNCGDWVESCTALLEYDDGTIKLYHHQTRQSKVLENLSDVNQG